MSNNFPSMDIDKITENLIKDIEGVFCNNKYKLEGYKFDLEHSEFGLCFNRLHFVKGNNHYLLPVDRLYTIELLEEYRKKKHNRRVSDELD